MVKDSIHP